MASRYSLVREIGRGGMGAVWLGHDDVLGRDVALKRLGGLPGAHGAASPDIERAAREARLAASLNHPHVVSVYDLVDDGESQWLVMEYVKGSTLANLVKRDGPMGPDDAAHILVQVADALAAAHAAGIVHRDVKPSNILVTPDGNAKLSDFGIARAEADAALTQTGLVTGSPAYLSPEVVSGRTARPPSDVWSLGATAFHAMEGHPPYDIDQDLMGAMYRIVHEQPPNSSAAGWLAPLLARTMTPVPSDRWTMWQAREFLASHGARIGHWDAADAAEDTAEPATVVTPTVAPGELVAASPASPGSPRDDDPRGSGARRGVVIALVALACVLGAAAAGWALLGQDPDDQDRANRPPASQTADDPSTSPTEPPSSPTEPTTPVEPPTKAEIETFMRDYVDTAMTDPQAAFKQLEPSFQEASGGYASWTGWWGGKRSATVTAVKADPDGLTATYTVDYVYLDGRREALTSTVSLIQEADGTLKIAGEIN